MKQIRVRTVVALILAGSCVAAGVCHGQQISVPRIELMPNKPSPYVMRNWKQVAREYDSLVFNPNTTGIYLPLVAAGQNFSLASYVGQTPSQTKEAINCLAAVVGAGLVGVDKSSQYGYDWVSKCENWFNQSPSESVYLNSPGGTSGSDWWYDVMPNVFFYQLCSMYPSKGNFPGQFVNVADRWLAAVHAMGGSTTPWGLANVDHRAWVLATMKPNDASVHEPEAAGSIAWLLYSAYTQTGNQKYRIGAELAMESLLVYPAGTNPSYELQLPYGAAAAARMNAELGTSYDIVKLVDWCFSDGADNPRLWGVTTGRWGAYDCGGLIGETGYGSGNGYAFAMNTFEQVGALVPLVRYDARFARIIGKWVLNAANASRLFYAQYLPDGNQDGAAWSHTYDPQSTIAHESMHQTNPANGTVTPYATGDAIRNGNPTNFALYGSSHVGIFGGIIDTTDVPMILKLDLLKTDYFHASAFPSSLLYNPDSVQHQVTFDVGAGQHDVYDGVSHSFILQGVSGIVLLPIGVNSAVLAVTAPAGGTVTYDLDKMLVNVVVVDFHSGHSVANIPPRIKSLAPDSGTVLKKGSVFLYCTAGDVNGDTLSYVWNASSGSIVGSGPVVMWTAPDSSELSVIQCTVSDGHGGLAAAADTISVVPKVNHAPVIGGMKSSPRKLNLGANALIACHASDPDSNALAYHWSGPTGTISGSGPIVNWQAPAYAGNFYVRCIVDDGQGGVTADSIALEVRDFSSWPTGTLIAYYPFNGDTKDASGNHHDGTASGGSFTADRFGNSGGAYSFDGGSASIDIPNDSSLNFQGGITLNFWMKVHAFYSREQYPLSHGNWMNRWKISITNQRLRWTVKTSTGIKDLDSETTLGLDSLYNVTVTYNGSDIEIYLNGGLDAFATWSGAVSTTTYDLTFGQDLPGDSNYDFNGVLDEVRLFNYMLPVAQISAFYDLGTGIQSGADPRMPSDFALEQNYPNPFNPSTRIQVVIPAKSAGTAVKLFVLDLLGRRIETLFDGIMSPGMHTMVWDAAKHSSGVYYCRLETNAGTQTRKMLLVR